MIRPQVKAAEALVRQEQPSRVQVTTGPNRIFEEGQTMLIREEPLLASLRSKEAVLKTQLGDAMNEMRDFNDNEVRIADLQREIDMRAASYGRYTDNLRQAGIDQALETKRISNINIVQPASYQPKAVYPRVGRTLLFGLILASLSSIGVAMAAEANDHSFRSAEHIEQHLQIPVLATLSRMQLANHAGNGHG